jgi:hypothetical protein
MQVNADNVVLLALLGALAISVEARTLHQATGNYSRLNPLNITTNINKTFAESIKAANIPVNVSYSMGVLDAICEYCIAPLCIHQSGPESIMPGNVLPHLASSPRA